MNLKTITNNFIYFLQENNYRVLMITAAFLLMISNLFFSHEWGIYMTFLLVIILIEVIIASVFLLFNTTTLILAMFLQEGLSEIEKKWVQQRIRKNVTITSMWLLFIIASFLSIAPHLGIIAGMYLISLVIIFKIAGTEENPFLEKRYEMFNA